MGQANRDADPAGMYEGVDGHFYEEQRRDINPVRRWFHNNRYRIANSLLRARYSEGMKLVDFGCGSCDWNAGGLPVTGVDLNEDLLRVGGARGRLAETLVADAADTGLADASVDVVSAFELLEHLAEPQRVVAEMHRVLKPGGTAVVSVPHDTVFSLWRPLFALQVLYQGWLKGDAYYRRRCGHVQRFRPESIAALFAGNGFGVELVFSMRRMSVFLVARKGESCDEVLPAPDVTLILPTLNEAKSLGRVLGLLTGRHPGVTVVVADDGSTDGTREIAERFGPDGVRFLDRSGAETHGLTASVLDAMGRASTPYVVVIDADGQHPPEKVAEVIRLLRSGSNLVVASRVAVEDDWPLPRKCLSYVGTALGKTSLLLRGKRYLSYDILSGFFGASRELLCSVIDEVAHSRGFRPTGYKVLFDLLKLLPRDQELEEVYYRFETRRGGASKLNTTTHLEYLKSVFR